MRDDRTSYTPHLLLTAVIATWAGSFVVAKLAMEEVTPFALVAARFACRARRRARRARGGARRHCAPAADGAHSCDGARRRERLDDDTRR